MAGSFNTFQRTMLLWDELHSYNAVHVAKVAAPLDAERLRVTLVRVLEGRGIARIGISADGRRFDFRDGPADVDIKVLRGGDVREALRAEIEWQVNERFPRTAAFTPFRFFVVVEAGAFWLGVAYFHAIADAEPVVRLMGDFIRAYASGDTVEKFARWGCDHTTAARRPWRPGLWWRKLASARSQFSVMRRSIRPLCYDSNEMRNAVELFTLDGDALAALKSAARAQGVTLNDLFLALLMSALAPMAAAQRKPGRSLLALGCIVNARRDLGSAEEDEFGLSLGSFSVACEAAESQSVAELARAISTQTQRLKTGGLYLANTMELSLTLRLLSFFSTERRRRFYAKNYPLWGGITNMNLSNLDPQSPGAPVDYVRAVSTGPATPLVLSITTVGGRVNCSLSWRVSFFSSVEIARVRERFESSVWEAGTPA